MSNEPAKVEPISDTALLVKRLLAIDVILAKAIGATDQQVYRVVERRMYKSLNAVFLPMADAALSEISGFDNDNPATESESKALAASICKHFSNWKSKTNDVVKTVVEDVYGSSKRQARARVLVLRKKSMRVQKAGPSLNASFNTEDENAINALAGHQTFWIGQQYTDNLSKQISAFTDDFMLRSGLGRREAGERLKDALAKEFGLKSGPLDRSPGLELPAGWRGTTQQYFRMLSANTVTNARTQGSLREMRSLGVVKYKVVNPEDEKTCPTCEHMDGQVFEVEEAITRLDLEVNSDPDGVRDIHPWAKNASDLKQASSLMASGYGYPPYHGDCRCGLDVDEESMPELQDIPDEIDSEGAPSNDEYSDMDWGDAMSFDEESMGEAQMWGETEWERWATQLTDDQVRALQSYQGAAHHQVNQLLRGIRTDEQIPNSEKFRNYIGEIGDALASTKTPNDVVVYRGLDNWKAHGIFKSGAVLEDRGFVSTSLSKKESKEFTFGPDKAYMEILVPKGSHAAYIDAASGQLGSEKELLLQKGTRFHIVSVDHKEEGGKPFTVIKAVAEVP